MRVDISAEYRRGMWNIAIKNIANIEKTGLLLSTTGSQQNLKGWGIFLIWVWV
jgi:hypothetical protein